MLETQNLLIADSNRTRSRVFANSRLISLFCFNLIELLSGHFLVCECEAQLRLCVKIESQLSNNASYLESDTIGIITKLIGITICLID